MSVFDTMRIAASGMTAQRFRMDVAAGNLANARSTRSTTGTIYQPVAPVFEAVTMSTDGAQGVAAVGVANIGGDPIRVYDPTHPDADAQGYVLYPAVDAATQMTDLMGASRSYSMNATVTQAAKQTALDAIDIGK
ncbi:MAG: flagellar basal body rod protein FlgC [Chloroflexota bacterium]